MANATSPTTSYVPLVPYEKGSCSCWSKGLKFFPVIMAILTVAMALFAALIYAEAIPMNGMEWVFRLSIAGAVLGPLMTVGLVCLWKGAYNHIYPQGNWIDFLKRDWNDFLGKNYQHYDAWEKAQAVK
jgi:hypothetical protein